MQYEIYFKAIYSILLLGGFLFVVFYLLKQTAVDSYRQSLFALRDGLFDEARKGNIEFTNPAYQFLREEMNTQIRFSHKYSVWSLLGVMSTYLKHKEIYDEEINQELLEVRKDLTSEQMKLIDSYTEKADDLFFRYILFFSPEFIPIVFLAIPPILFFGYIKELERLVVNTNKAAIYEAAIA